MDGLFRQPDRGIGKEAVHTGMNRVSIEYRVPYADTDQMGVVYYANYFVLFERLRNELLRASGISYRQVEADGLMFPVIEAHCEYRRPARYDDVLLTHGWLAAAEGGRFRIEYEVMRDDELLVAGHTWHAVVSLDGRPRRVPEHIKRLL